MKAYRIETDSMGEVHVPAEAFYGAQTQRAVNNFTISSATMPWEFIRVVLIIKQVAAQVHQELQLLSGSQAQAIIKAVDHLLKSKEQHHFPVSVYQTGSGTSTNMNVNEVIATIARQCGVALSANDHVNMGQSSNDVIPTALQLSTAFEIQHTLLPALEILRTTIRKKGVEWQGVIKTGRTHLMDALPIPISAELEAWAVQIDEGIERLQADLSRLCRLPLGGTAVGSGVNCDPRFKERAVQLLAQKTNLPCTSMESAYKGISSLDSAIATSGNLRAVAVALSKIANDLRWMNSGPLTGLADIQLPALQPGSSIMPAKINPVIPEAVLMAVARVIGHDTTISLGAMGGSFQLNTMLPVVASSLLESVSLLSGSALSLAENAIEKMTVNRDHLEQALKRNPILVTALNPHVGYMKAAHIAKKAIAENRSILEVALEETNLGREKLEQLLDPTNLALGG